MVQPLHDPPGPANLDPIDLGVVAEAEVYHPARLGQVTARRVHLPHHHGLPDPQPHHGTDRVAVAVGSCQPQLHIVPSGKPVGEVVRTVIEVVGYDLEPTVAVEIGYDGSPRAARRLPAGDALFLINAARRRLDAQVSRPVAERSIAVV